MRQIFVSVLAGVIGGVIAMMAFSASDIIAKGKPGIIKAMEFQVINEKGEKVAYWGIVDDQINLVLGSDAGGIVLGTSGNNENIIVLGNLITSPSLTLMTDPIRSGIRANGEKEIRIELSKSIGNPYLTIGSTVLTNTKTNATTHYQPSTITIFKDDGSVAWQVP